MVNLKAVPRSNLVVSGIILGLIVAGIAVVLPIFYSADRTSTKANDPIFSETTENVDRRITVYVGLTGINPAAYTADLKISIDPETTTDTFVSDNGRVADPFVIFVDALPPNEELEFKGTVFKEYNPTVSIAKGSLDLYPFDKYDVSITLSAAGKKDNEPISLVVIPYFVNLYGWTVKNSKDTGSSDGVVEFNFTIQRSAIFMIYPIFQMIAFWLLSIMEFSIVCAIVIWGSKKFELPTIGIYVALLFALPTFRNTAPGNPGFGVAMDYGAFFWALVLAAVSMLMMLGKYASLP